MQIRQTATLENLLAKGAFDSEKQNITCQHLDRLFLSIVSEENCHAAHILRRLLKDWELYQIRIRTERELSQPGSRKGLKPVGGAEFYSALPERIAAVTGAQRGEEAQPLLNTGHLLMFIAGDRSTIAARSMEMYGVTPQRIGDILAALPAEEDCYGEMTAPGRLREEESGAGWDDSDLMPLPHGAQAAAGVLDKVAVNLTQAAAEGRIDPVTGREKEIERLVQILARRKKNNPILIGEAGVGKSAIVEGLALRMHSGDVPLSLRGKQLYSLDVASLIAGTKYRGEFEERMKELLAELSAGKETVLFIDEIHTIVGAGSTQGSLDAANMLKPALARGELQCIGATTLDEYRENIESDGALERRFQKIIVEPATREQTLAILRNARSRYERHHMVRYTDEALLACVELTERYVTDRHFPDKALDVLDEAGARARTFGSREPEYIRDIERGLDEARRQRRSAVAALVYEKAAAARLRELALRSKLNESRSTWERQLQNNPVEIGPAQIEEVITSMTGIPVERVSQGEQSRLRGMYDHLSSLVVGQSEAVRKVTASIQRSRAGLKDPGKPTGVFMFVGPTGVGKTLLAKELSQWMFDRRDALIRIDMSEYSEKHNVSRLIGSPPGYVGYGEGGQLTEAVRRQPYAVVLFDEIEKAHPDVFNIMLQIFDEGCLTDGLGRKVDFRNTIIIMTSNAGSREAEQRSGLVGYNTATRPATQAQSSDAGYRRALEATFAPEFINRIDDIVIFNTLTVEDVERIVDIELAGLSTRAAKMGYELEITPEARRELARLGYESRYGVRSLKRTILERVEEPLAGMIVNGEVCAGDRITLHADALSLALRKAV